MTSAFSFALAGLFGLSACTVGGSKGVGVENARLRTELAETQRQVAALNAQREELLTKLAEANNARQAALTPEVLASLPRVAGVRIGSLSGLAPSDRALAATRADIYVEPFDGRDRFVQIVGTLSVEVVAMGQVAEGKEPPRVLASQVLTPAQVRDAYRSGFTGTHYSVELPFSPPITERKGTLLLRVRFTDALSGREFAAEKAIELGKN
jgi:hypothetical protein